MDVQKEFEEAAQIKLTDAERQWLYPIAKSAGITGETAAFIYKIFKSLKTS